MTPEEKLLLQQKKLAAAAAPTAPLTATAAAGTAPTAAPAPTAPITIAAPDDGLPPPAEGLEPLPDTDATGADIRAAAWDAETIKTDAWNYTQRKRQALATDIYARLPPDAKARIENLRWDPENGWTRFEAMVLDEVAKSAIATPGDWADVPLTLEAFDARIDQERKAELNEAMAILNQPGGGFSEFIGTAGRAMTDQASLMMLPLGLEGGFLRVVASEAALGALGEAAVIPREQQVAEELDLPQPDVLSRMAMGAATGGLFSGALLGAAKGIAMYAGRRASIRAATPKGGDELSSEIAIDKAEAGLRGEPTVQEVIKGNTAPLPGAENLPYNEAATLRAIIGTESGGNAKAKNPNSSATGLGQFIGPTWLAMIRKYRPDVAEGKTSNEILALRNDPALSIEMTAMYGRETAATLQSNGLTVDPGAIYLGHFMGPGGVVKAMKAPLDTPITALMSPKEIAANAGIRYGNIRFADFTAGDLRRWSAHKMRSAYDPNASRDMPDYSGGTSRGYTGDGQVSTGSGSRIDVTYEVVDLDSLINASGVYQPRDRSRSNSDAWVADTAARLDPAQLMPSPTADRGAPIVGPDNMIESGNGRSMAIARAYEYHPDRASAYRAQIEAAGYAVPEGVTRPILIARRTSDMTQDERVRFTVDAQDSGVAAMTPTEVARASSRAMTGPVLGRFDPSQALSSEANADFVRAALQSLPRSARNAMFDARGMLNKSGERQLSEAIFARAWSDPDIVEMFAEADQGDLKSLMEALNRSAPSWAALKADIETGAVRPEMDISGHVLDAMRLIASARALASRDKMSIANALSELLDDQDLLNGAVAPLTVAMVRKFWRNGRAASADDVASFLTRYADDARRAGAEGALFDAPTPRDVLRAIDKDTFADLPEDLGPVRGFARPGQDAPKVHTIAQGYDAGAKSPEVEADDLAARDLLSQSAEGPFGPVFAGFGDNPEGAIAKLLTEKSGEISDAVTRTDLGSISLIYGNDKFGLRHIEAKHPDMIADLPRLLRDGQLVGKIKDRAYLQLPGDAPASAVIRLDWDGKDRTWLVTAFEDMEGQIARQLRRSNEPTASASSRIPDATGQGKDTAPAPENQGSADMAGLDEPRLQHAVDPALEAAQADIADARAQFADDLDSLEVDAGDGSTTTLREFLADLDADAETVAAIRACAISQGTP